MEKSTVILGSIASTLFSGITNETDGSLDSITTIFNSFTPPEECVFARNYTFQEIMSLSILGTVIDRFSYMFLAFLIVFAFYSIVRANGKVNHARGINVMRWPFTRIMYFRLAPVQIYQEPENAGLSAEKVHWFNLMWRLSTFNWVSTLFKYSDEDIERIAGQDGKRYLSVAGGINMILMVPALSAAYLVAMNVIGGYGEKVPSFWGATSLANLNSSANDVELGALGVAFVTYFIALGVIVWIGRRNKLFGPDRDKKTNRPVLFISGIDLRDCAAPERIVDYLLDRAGQNIDIEKIVVVRGNDAKIEELEEKLDIVRTTIRLLTQRRKQEMVRVPTPFSPKRIDAFEYYRELETRLIEDIQRETENNSITGSVFVHFKSELDALIAFHGFGNCMPIVSMVSETLEYILTTFTKQPSNPKKWFVSFASPKGDYESANLGRYSPKRNCQSKLLTGLFVWLIMALGVLLPVYLDDIIKNRYPGFLDSQMGGALWSTFRFFSNSFVMEILTRWDEWVVKDLYKSRREIDVFHRVLVLWTLTDLVFPLLNIDHVDVIVDWFKGRDISWGRVLCMVRPDVGIDMTNSLIMLSFLRNCFSLSRIAHWNEIDSSSVRTKTEAEVRHSRKSIQMELGYRYADYIFLYYIVVVSAISHPLVPLFGLICIGIRFYIDKHNLCNTFDKSLSDDELHRRVIPALFFPFIVQSIQQLLYNLVRDFEDAFDRKEPMDLSCLSIVSVLSIVYCAMTIVVFVIFYILADINQIRRYSYEQCNQPDDIDEVLNELESGNTIELVEDGSSTSSSGSDCS